MNKCYYLLESFLDEGIMDKLAGRMPDLIAKQWAGKLANAKIINNDPASIAKLAKTLSTQRGWSSVSRSVRRRNLPFSNQMNQISNNVALKRQASARMIKKPISQWPAQRPAMA